MTDFPRYVATGTAGSRRIGQTTMQYAVLDRFTSERISWHRTFKTAQASARRMNERLKKDVG